MKPRRIYIRRDDVSKSRYGTTPGCRGREATNIGQVGIHDERCRNRIDAEASKKDPERDSRLLIMLVKRLVIMPSDFT